MKKQYFCDTHNRKATHINKQGDHVCDPSLGGITMPCHVKEIVEDKLVMTTLYFSRSTFGDDEGQYMGKITFGNKKGEISVALDSKLSSMMLEVCKDNIKELAAEATSMFVL